MTGYAIGIPTLEMSLGVGGRTNALIQAARSNKNFIKEGFSGGFATLIFNTKESAVAAYMVARRLDFEIIVVGEVTYDL